MRRPTSTSNAELQATLADAFEHCAHGLAIGNPADNTVLACNHAFARLVGRTVGDVVGRPILSLYHRSAHDVVRRAIADADRDGRVQYEALCVREDGSTLPVQMDVVCVRDARGVPAYRVATTLDLSERHATGRALRATEERLRTVIEHMSEGLVITDLDGMVVHWNRAALAMHEFSSMDDVRRPLAEFVRLFQLATRDGRVLPFDEWPLVRIVRGDALHEVEVVVTGVDRPFERILRCSGERVTDSEGRTVAFATITDLTERERLAAQLRQSQKVEAIGQLAGGVAHDFNNIITVIAGNADLLASDVRDRPESMRLVDELREAATRAAALTAQLLAFSRAQVVAPRRVDVNDEVRGCDSMLRRLIGEHVRLECALSTAPCVVTIDPGQLEQVILNLVINARDAMPRGGTVRVETESVAVDAATAARHEGLAPGPFVRLSVRDEGCGMAPEVLARIFEPFYTTKERGRGTGLGLATVCRIVAESGGRIDVSSAPGAGTAMSVLLPRSEVTAEGVPRRRAAPSARGLETVLLVEDDEGVRKLARAALARQGYRVIVANDGHAAVALGDEALAAVDLLVTDLVMPGCSGHDVAVALRARRPGLKVVFMSGYVADEAVRESLSAEGSRFLAKPFEIAVLADTVRRALDEASPD